MALLGLGAGKAEDQYPTIRSSQDLQLETGTIGIPASSWRPEVFESSERGSPGTDLTASQCAQ